jgi:uncharacterized protein (TIGR03435 family)
MLRLTMIAGVLALTASVLPAQTPPPAFEVASIKPADPAASGSSTRTNQGRLTMSNVTLRRCIMYAYNIHEYQLSGGPDWIDTARYEIAAKVEDGAEKLTGRANRERMAVMLQTLLADRFKLVVHRETKSMAAYSLTVAKNGPKPELKLLEGTDGSTSTSFNGRTVTAKTTMDDLAVFLSNVLDRPVVDQTGLKGIYQFKLEWTPDDAHEPGISIFTALQEQLGLKLEGTKADVEKIIVDHAEKAVEN